MRLDLEWTIDAIRDLQSLDSHIADRVTKKVVWFTKQADPFRHAQPLVGAYKGIFRFRIGEYRVLFEKNTRGQIHVLMVLRVKHRRDVYR